MTEYVGMEANNLMRKQNRILERIAVALETIVERGDESVIHLKD